MGASAPCGSGHPSVNFIVQHSASEQTLVSLCIWYSKQMCRCAPHHLSAPLCPLALLRGHNTPGWESSRRLQGEDPHGPLLDEEDGEAVC